METVAIIVDGGCIMGVFKTIKGALDRLFDTSGVKYLRAPNGELIGEDGHTVPGLKIEIHTVE